MVAQGKDKEPEYKIRSYSASSRCQKDVQSLQKIGMTARQITFALDIPQSTVERHKARLEEYEIRRRRFILTGSMIDPKWSGGTFHILQK